MSPNLDPNIVESEEIGYTEYINKKALFSLQKFLSKFKNRYTRNKKTMLHDVNHCLKTAIIILKQEYRVTDKNKRYTHNYLDEVTSIILNKEKKAIITYDKYSDEKIYYLKDIYLNSAAKALLYNNKNLIKEKTIFIEKKNKETNKYEYFERSKYFEFNSEIYSKEEYCLVNNKLYSFKELKNKRYFGMNEEKEIWLHSTITDSDWVPLSMSINELCLPQHNSQLENPDLFINKLISKVIKNKNILLNILRNKDNIAILKEIKFDENTKFILSCNKILSCFELSNSIKMNIDKDIIIDQNCYDEFSALPAIYYEIDRQIAIPQTSRINYAQHIKIKNAFEYIVLTKILMSGTRNKMLEYGSYLINNDVEINDAQ